MTHEYYMGEALKEAAKAKDRNEVPIGAVITSGDTIIARAYNLVENLVDPTAHAEMQAITIATSAFGGKYLTDCTLYVTVEPCPMCASAIAWAQIKRVVYGAPDIKRGFSNYSPSLMHPKTEIISGILEDRCAEIITDFFKERR